MVYGVGYSSTQAGHYSNPTDKCFLVWRNMLKRCYSNEEKYKNYRDQGISVCEEWHDFDVFEKWFNRNYYEVNDEVMNLDKDILKHGNKVYCPEHCIFVPQTINLIFVRSANRRGELPIGVHLESRTGKYVSSCSVYGRSVKSKHNDLMSAFVRYKQVKESHIKEMALRYRSVIPEQLYNAMMMFEVCFSD